MPHPLARLGVLATAVVLAAVVGTGVAGAAERPAQGGRPVMVGPATGLEPAAGPADAPGAGNERAPKAPGRQSPQVEVQQAQAPQAQAPQAQAPQAPQPDPQPAQEPRAQEPRSVRAQQPRPLPAQAGPRAARAAAPAPARPAAAAPARPRAAQAAAPVRALRSGPSRLLLPARARPRVVTPVPIGPRVPAQTRTPVMGPQAPAVPARPVGGDRTDRGHMELAALPGLATGTAQAVARTPGVPLGLIALVIVFLLLQSRMDDRDPKLGLARVEEDEPLEFAQTGIVHLRGGHVV